MKNILFIPLDERPCNYGNVIRLMDTVEDINLIYPPRDLFHNVAKHPVDTKVLWNFVLDNFEKCEYAIFSIDMLFHGGLIPSRIHNRTDEKEIENFVSKLRNLKKINTNCKVFVSGMIMRTPRYNSNRQEPDYYEDFGKRIFKYGVLKDKKARGIINENEKTEFKQLGEEIPKEYIEDFENRRKFNIRIVSETIKLVKESIIDFMIIPQDDSYPFGYTAIDQQKIYQLIKTESLNNKILTYNGADESGYTLTARVVNEIRNIQPKIFPIYSSVFGQFVVPKYEDRVIGESLKSHALAAGFRLTETAESADVILAYNTPAKEMKEASEQFEMDIHYYRERNLPHFVHEISHYLKEGKKVAICDSAYANGGDLQLLQMLNDSTILLNNLISYRAWNTNCNTLGSVLGEVSILLDTSREETRGNLLANIFEDVLYEGLIRKELVDNYLPNHPEVEYDEIEKNVDELVEIIHDRILELYPEYLSNNSFGKIEQLCVRLPWNRLFNAWFNINFKS